MISKNLSSLALVLVASISGFFFQINAKASTLTVTEEFDFFAKGDLVSGAGIFKDFILSAGNDPIKVSDKTLEPDWMGNILQTYPFSSVYPFRADFSILNVKEVSVLLGDFRADSDNLFLRAFDDFGNVLDESLLTIDDSVLGGGQLTVTTTNDNIAYVEFGSTGSYQNSVYADRLSYKVVATVPETNSVFGLLVLVVLGTIVSSRSLKRKGFELQAGEPIVQDSEY
ncbi:MAG: hypothetical protein F6J89_31040 [Symploca sp. SIO1C4]|uniref:PEP-CTERM sorting domain-containing protein n=1 Tax=Symploca sp. SIO1C4 TaxID=2607765 RepID=A0A6B3NJH2_9CYAN|nr:hypothetical protein [Symploca sp. SIO1C4]